MAALALALGLSDMIQAEKSAVNLDMLFIDEGFGSLDDFARRRAVTVLENIAAGNRLTGVISHVDALANEIDDELVVTKDAHGSHAEWKS